MSSHRNMMLAIIIVASAGVSLFGGYMYTRSQMESEVSRLEEELKILQNTVEALKAYNMELNKTNNQLKNIIVEKELEYSALLEDYTSLMEEMNKLRNETYQLRYEKVEIHSIIPSWMTKDEKWRLTLDIENSGTCIVILDKVFVNGLEVDSYDDEVPGAGEATTDLKVPYILYTGKRFTLHIYVDGGPDSWQGASVGTLIEVKLHTIDGIEYSAETTLI